MANEYDLNKADNDTWYDGDIKIVVEGIIYNHQQSFKSRGTQKDSSGATDARYLGPTANGYSLSLFTNNWAQTTTGMSSKTSTSITGNEYYKDDNDTFTLTSYAMPLLSSSSQVLIMPNYEIYELYDECDDSSLNGSLWTRVSGSDTATEDSTNISLTSSTDSTEYRSNALSNGDLVVCDFDLVNGYDGSANAEAHIGITDGTNDVALVTASTGGNISGKLILRIDTTNERVFYEIIGRKYDVSGNFGTGNTYDRTYPFHKSGYISISSLSTNYYFWFAANKSSSQTSTVRIYNLRKGKASPSTTITTSVSRDGSTYTDFTKPIFLSTASGSTITLRATGTVASNEVLVFKGWDIKELT